MPGDLHIHTHYSDSSYSPEEVIEIAKKIGLNVISITDHDNIEGISKAIEKAKDTEIEVIPGVELSVKNRFFPEKDIHILGYFIDYQDKEFIDFLERFQKRRYERAIEMVEKLNSCGINITFEEVKKLSRKGVFGKLHIALAVYKKGEFNSIEEIFREYLDYGKKAYAEKYRLEIGEAIKVINKYKGIPILAHPIYSKCEHIIEEAVSFGLKGVEVYHPEHSIEDCRRILEIAKKYNLLITGGSDCHGLNKREVFIGKVKIEDYLIERLKEYRLRM